MCPTFAAMQSKTNRGIVLINLGSPESPNKADVRKYLDEFLMDERVIDKPFLSRALLVRGIIIPFRVAKSSAAYRKIWTKEGSPLIVCTDELKEAVEALSGEPVEVCMRYGKPTPANAFDALLERNPQIEEVVLFPLYPHYAMSSYETAAEHVKAAYKERNYPFKLTLIDPYYDEPAYIDALAESMKPYLQQDFDHLLFSYHGIPERHIRKSDVTGCHCLQVENCCEQKSPAHAFCYRHQVLTTTRLVAERLRLSPEKFSVSFQSRLGSGWLTPFTDERLQQLPSRGVKKLLVACPAFVGDCLETLEEIAMEGKKQFLDAGGEHFEMIPCLNTHPRWIEAIYRLIESSNPQPQPLPVASNP